MNLKLLVQTLLTIALLVIVTGCDPDPEPATEPSGIVSDEGGPTADFTPSSKCKVPDVVGLAQGAAEGNLVAMGLQPVISKQYNDLIAEGAAISQEPPADTLVEPCQGDVEIVVSLGPVPVPTETPRPTDTPSPTDRPSPTETLSPTDTPIPPITTPEPSPILPTITPTSNQILFFDDFNQGIKPDWQADFGEWRMVDGQLTAVQFVDELARIFVGDPNWRNYKVDLSTGPIIKKNATGIYVRFQDNRILCGSLFMKRKLYAKYTETGCKLR